ncbi:hypothetical protein V5799_011092 [Amblyomma americanum]|uniref:Uncharacterized protein n=1 Tax=Amblyomma americanum TaxID=6943 RepID=A0AAQ4EIA3_AMBAM
MAHIALGCLLTMQGGRQFGSFAVCKSWCTKAYRPAEDTNAFHADASCQRNEGPRADASGGRRRGDLLLLNCRRRWDRAPVFQLGATADEARMELHWSSVPVLGHRRMEAARRGLQCLPQVRWLWPSCALPTPTGLAVSRVVLGVFGDFTSGPAVTAACRARCLPVPIVTCQKHLGFPAPSSNAHH